jgi:hypothetical protein
MNDLEMGGWIFILAFIAFSFGFGVYLDKQEDL